MSTPASSRPASVPPWRRDFPVETAQEQYVARRDFTRFLVLTSVAFAAGQLWLGVQNWLRRWRGQLPVAPLPEAHRVPVGGALTFHYPDRHDACLLLRPDEHTFVAYSQKCTHLGCAVVPGPGPNELRCPCHNGHFDLASGRPLAGPPRRPLPRITLENRDGQLCAVGMEVTTV
jgi:Rieske Fe-S protein